MKETKKKQKDPSFFPKHGPFVNGKEVLVSLKNVDITFGKKNKTVKAVKNASFDIYKGETFSLVGESGSGKTTIGRAIMRIHPCSNGDIFYKGVKITGKIPSKMDKEIIRNIQMVFQDPSASLNERATIDYIISEGLYNFKLFEDEKDRVNKIENIMEEVGLLKEHLTRYPHEFSGGQRQRIGLARAIVMEPELIVADEPISALDVSIRAQILNLLKKFQRSKNITYLFIAHDLSIVRFISDRIGVIYKGNIVEIAEAEELFSYPLHPYTKSLISAIPIPDPILEKKKVLVVYDEKSHDYSKDLPSLVDIGHNHFVYGNDKEIKKYTQIREGNFQHTKEGQEEKSENFMPESTEYVINEKDASSKWYSSIAFLFPIIGVLLYLAFKYFKLYQASLSAKKGMLYGIIFYSCIIGGWLLCLLFALFI